MLRFFVITSQIALILLMVFCNRDVQNRSDELLAPITKQVNEIKQINKRTITHINRSTKRTTIKKRITNKNLSERYFDSLPAIEQKKALLNLTPTEVKLFFKHYFNESVYSNLSTLAPQSSVFVVFENDILTQSGDHYFTNGVEIGLSNPFLVESPINNLLHPYTYNGINSYGISITQNIYTPKHPDIDEIHYNDRPFSGVLFVRHYKNTYDPTKNIKLYSHLDLGVLGPLSFAGRIQRSMHNKKPKDWLVQINNTPYINYLIALSKIIPIGKYFNISTNFKLEAGSIYNNIAPEIKINIGNGSDAFSSKNNWWSLYSQLQYKRVFYDATLRGGFFSKNTYFIHNKDITKNVIHVESGVRFKIKHILLGIQYNYLSKEFNTGESHSWGQIQVNYIY